jgi:hypothetical protein
MSTHFTFRLSQMTGVAMVGAIAALATVGTSSAMAQDLQISPATEAANFSGKTIPEEIERAFFEHDPDFFENRKIHRQFSYLFGPGLLVTNSFPENEIARDAKEIHSVYTTVLANQMAAGPRIRTVDLPNPFAMSVRTMPVFVSSGPLPSTPMPRVPVAPAPVSDGPVAPAPVPALW